MQRNRIDAVVFDLDGTLIDTEALCNETGIEACRGLGHDVSLAFFESLAGIDDANRVRLISAEVGAELEPLAFYAEWDRRCVARFEDGVPMKPGVPDILEQLRSKGLPLAICTSSRRVMADAKIAAAGLDGLIDAVISVDDVSHPKPHAAPYLAAARALGVDPARTLAVEDSDTGVASAVAAGMIVLQVPDISVPKTDAATLIAPTIAEGLATFGL